MKPAMPPFVGMVFGGAPAGNVGSLPGDPQTPAKRPYRNLDVWPRARAMLAAAAEPISAGEIARALGVESKNVLTEFYRHADEVERSGERMKYRWRLRGAA